MLDQILAFLNAHFDSLWWLIWWALLFRVGRGLYRIYSK